MSTRRRHVLQHHRLCIEIVNNQIEPAITIKIANRKPTSGPRVRKRIPRRRTHSFKLSLHIAKQQRLLRVTRPPLVLISRGINMSIHNKQIEPAIVVVVDKTRSPTQKRNRNFTKPGLKCYVSKIVVAVVVIKNIRIVREVGDMKIHATVVVTITNSESHPSLLATILIQRHA